MWFSLTITRSTCASGCHLSATSQSICCHLPPVNPSPSSVTGPSDPPYVVVPWPWDSATEIDHLPIYYRLPTRAPWHNGRERKRLKIKSLLPKYATEAIMPTVFRCPYGTNQSPTSYNRTSIRPIETLSLMDALDSYSKRGGEKPTT